MIKEKGVGVKGLDYVLERKVDRQAIISICLRMRSDKITRAYFYDMDRTETYMCNILRLLPLCSNKYQKDLMLRVQSVQPAANLGHRIEEQIFRLSGFA